MPYIGQAPAPKVITSSDLSADVVTEAKIADNAVENEHLNANVITGHTALGAEPADTDEFLVSDAGTLKRIDYSYIKGGGGLIHLNTTVASSSSNVTFNSSILTSTYNAYKIIISGMRGSSDNNHVEVYYSFDNGSSYESSNYMFSSTGRDSDGNEVHAHTGTASKIEITANTAGYDTDEGFNAELTLFNPSQTTRHKILAFNSYFFKTNGHIQRVLGIGTNDGSSSAVNNIKIQFQSGSIAEGQFSIFGVANS